MKKIALALLVAMTLGLTGNGADAQSSGTAAGAPGATSAAPTAGGAGTKHGLGLRRHRIRPLRRLIKKSFSKPKHPAQPAAQQ